MTKNAKNWADSEERAEKHAIMYDDLKEWIMEVYDKEIAPHTPMNIVISQTHYRQHPRIIEGAFASLIIQEGVISSELIRHILHVLGSDEFSIIRGSGGIIMKVHVPLINPARTSMRMCGMWTPKWERNA